MACDHLGIHIESWPGCTAPWPLLVEGGQDCDLRRMAIEKPARDGVLSLFDGGDPLRAEEKYLLFRSKLVWYFDRHNCECPEGLADETVFRIVKAVSAGKVISAPFAFFWGVAENVRREEWKRLKSEPLEDSEGSQRWFSDLENGIYIDECLERSLSPEEVALWRSCYMNGYDATATRLGATIPALKVKVHRIRNKVRQFASSAAPKKYLGADET